MTSSVRTAAQAAYIVAALLFILTLAGLSKHETAKAGNIFGIAGMAHRPGRHHRAGPRPGHLRRRAGPAGRGRCSSAPAIGLWRARVVEMTGMPELIALLHTFVGLAAVLVGWNGYLQVEARPGRRRGAGASRPRTCSGIHPAEVFIGVFIGAVTFTGSIVAFLKLSARIKSDPADAAGQERAQPRRAGAVRRPDRLVRRSTRSCGC